MTMKKMMFMLAALLMLSTADANAQGFLKKLKQKAQQAVSGVAGNDASEEAEERNDADGCWYDWTKSPELADGDAGRWHSACLPVE